MLDVRPPVDLRLKMARTFLAIARQEQALSYEVLQVGPAYGPVVRGVACDTARIARDMLTDTWARLINATEEQLEVECAQVAALLDQAPPSTPTRRDIAARLIALAREQQAIAVDLVRAGAREDWFASGAIYVGILRTIAAAGATLAADVFGGTLSCSIDSAPNTSPEELERLLDEASQLLATEPP